MAGGFWIDPGYKPGSLVDDAAIGEKRLWRAVVLQIVVDLRRNDELCARRALAYVRADPDFDLVARLAGVDPALLRRVLMKRYWHHVARLTAHRASLPKRGRPRKHPDPSERLDHDPAQT